MGRLGIDSIQDLLFHLPLRYQDRSTIHSIGSLKPGAEIVVLGRIESCKVTFGRRRSLLTRIADDSGWLTIRQFHFSRAQQQGLENGAWLKCFGEVRVGPRSLEMVHPEYKILSDGQVPEAQTDEGWTAVYPVTQGLGQRQLNRLIEQALQWVEQVAEELLPEGFLATSKFPSLGDALRMLHRPGIADDPSRLVHFEHPARVRLGFEELLAHHLASYQSRSQRCLQGAPAITGIRQLWSNLESSLGFELTAAQQRAIEEIDRDISGSIPMHRLVQGDVGCGKTLVAAAACLGAIESGYQAALMAPTEILAEQHLRNFRNWFQPLGVDVDVLLGKQGVRERRVALEGIRSGITRMVIGTHALFQSDVEFDRLAIVVVDEQHRFGVLQRYQLREKGRLLDLVPHQLTMTATPIPRSLAMSLYADMDVTSIDELPPGRAPVETVVVPDKRRDDVLARIKRACKHGEQVYWVCPLIDDSDALEAQAATETAETLRRCLGGISVALVHGRMRTQDKEAVMQHFREREVQLLVATTVIEVGVDVPNASLMVIENAERLGLSQLHQLRGRVGRGAQKSYCVLMYKTPLGDLARERLRIMRKSNDGFEIARKDLEIRGPGELIGTRQTGMQRMVVADLMRDESMLPAVRRCAKRIVEEDPDRAGLIVQRWVKSPMELVNV